MRKPKSHLRNRKSLGITIGNPKARSARRAWMRALTGSLVVATAATLGGSAEAADVINRAGRFLGVGWGDGYHSCRDSGVRIAADLPPKTSGDMHREKRNHAANQAACNNIYPAGTALPNRQINPVAVRANPVERSTPIPCDQFSGCDPAIDSALPIEVECQPDDFPQTHLNYRSLPDAIESVQQPMEVETENPTAYDDAPSFVQPRRQTRLPVPSSPAITNQVPPAVPEQMELALPELDSAEDTHWRLNPPDVPSDVPAQSKAESSVQHDVPSGWPVADSVQSEPERWDDAAPQPEATSARGFDVGDPAAIADSVESEPTPSVVEGTLPETNATAPQISLPELDDDLLEEMDLDPIPGELFDESLEEDLPTEEPVIETPAIDRSASDAGQAPKVRFLPPVMPRKIPSPAVWDSTARDSSEKPNAQAALTPQLSSRSASASAVPDGQEVKENPFFATPESHQDNAGQSGTPHVAVKPMDPKTEAWKVIRQPR